MLSAFNFVEPEVHLNNVQSLSLYFTENTVHLHHNTNWSILFGEIITVCCENHTEYFVGKMLTFFNISIDGVYNVYFSKC
jgi:hypothetical protein